MVESKAQSIEEIIAKREKFDKDIQFDMTTLTARAGFRF